MNRLFVTTITDIREGASLTDLDEALSGLVQAIRETGRGGKLVYTLTIKPASKGRGDVVAVEDAITIKAPVAERASTILFARPDNSLSSRDPRQPELKGLREAKPTPFREREEATLEGASGE